MMTLYDNHKVMTLEIQLSIKSNTNVIGIKCCDHYNNYNTVSNIQYSTKTLTNNIIIHQHKNF